MAEKTKITIVEIELTKPHTHRGRLRAAGEKLELADWKAQRLIDAGKAKPVKDKYSAGESGATHHRGTP